MKRGPKRRPGETRRLVATGLAGGLTQSEIASVHGISKGTVSYHARRLGIPAKDACARRYDWAEIQAIS